MLYYSLSSLDKLDVIKVKELENAATRDREVPALSLDSFNLLDLDLAF
jgi:hypothetical protein